MNEEKRPDLHPQDYALRLFGRKNLFPWLLVFACMIAGALLGALLSLALPPVYEARALVSTNLELVQDANITEIMLDAEINHIGELVFHPEVVSALIEKEASLGNPLTLEQLKKITSVERQLMNTVIKVRDQNPEVAARIASEWAEILYTRLTDAYEHAVQLSSAKLQYNSIRDCLSAQPKRPNPFAALRLRKAPALNLTAWHRLSLGKPKNARPDGRAKRQSVPAGRTAGRASASCARCAHARGCVSGHGSWPCACRNIS